jgi:hypothetical protein
MGCGCRTPGRARRGSERVGLVRVSLLLQVCSCATGLVQLEAAQTCRTGTMTALVGR